jgi:hypothetical protein
MCDNSLATLSDGCAEKGDVACAVDKKAALECQDNKFVVGETCKGARGCEVKDGDKIRCDNDVSDADDPCHFVNDYACTPDKGMLLKCLDHKMTKLNSCRGHKGCRVFEIPEEKKIEFVCDDSVAMENDPCDEDNEHACSMDKKAIYVCKSNKFVSLKACPGPQGCSFDDKAEKFSCDTSSDPGKAVDVTRPTPAAMAKKGKGK